MKTTINNHLIFLSFPASVLKAKTPRRRTHEMIFAETKCYAMRGRLETKREIQ